MKFSIEQIPRRAARGVEKLPIYISTIEKFPFAILLMTIQLMIPKMKPIK